MLPDNEDEYEDDDDQADDDQSDDDQSDDDSSDDDQADDGEQDDDQHADAHQAIAQAAPGQVDAHRDMLSEVFRTLQGQGVDTDNLASQAGANSTDPNEMSHGDLIQTTLALARQHPEVVAMISQRFPAAQGILSSVVGSADGGQGGIGGMLGGMLGKL